MKNNIILQHFDGELRELDKLSIANIKNYADMIDADYELITGKPFRSHLTSPCQKVYMLDERFDEWENVLMLDIDMFAPKGMSKNVFDENGIGIRNDVQTVLHGKISKSYPSIASKTAPYWGGAIYKMNRSMRQKLRSGLGKNEDWMNNYNKSYHFEDEGIMHTLATKASLIHSIDMYLNNKWCQCSYLPHPEKAGFIHIRTKIYPNGPKREKIENYRDLVERGIL
jgi:hypothetical protein